jgi:hypothetical protein
VRSARLSEAIDDPLLLAASWAHVGDKVATPAQRKSARVAWLAAPAPASAGPAGALPVVAVATSSPSDTAPPAATAPSVETRRPQRAVCPSCLIWHPIDEVADGCPQCGTACVVPPRITQPTEEAARTEAAVS